MDLSPHPQVFERKRIINWSQVCNANILHQQIKTNLARIIITIAKIYYYMQLFLRNLKQNHSLSSVSSLRLFHLHISPGTRSLVQSPSFQAHNSLVGVRIKVSGLPRRRAGSLVWQRITNSPPKQRSYPWRIHGKMCYFTYIWCFY